MNEKLIYGIQQIGVGVDNAQGAFKWYATKLGSDIMIFDDKNEATYMAPYMGGKPREKRAILAINMQGGSGYELWQHTGRTPKKPVENIQLGDLGINIAKIKSKDIYRSYKRLKGEQVEIISDISQDPDGRKKFFIRDPWENILQIKESSSWYTDRKFDIGGNFGCIIGVSDIGHSLKLYSKILQYNHVVYDKTGNFADLGSLPNGNGKFRRILLSHKDKRVGGFSELFGYSEIELVQCLDRKPNKIFQDRYWGDIGFIHLCFDIRNMKAVVNECKNAGFPFTVLSNDSFDMGDANGHWGYLEDPDGTLIEFVETHKVPILKKLNLNINLRNRNPLKPLPNWLIKAMSMKRVKFGAPS